MKKKVIIFISLVTIVAILFTCILSGCANKNKKVGKYIQQGEVIDVKYNQEYDYSEITVQYTNKCDVFAAFDYTRPSEDSYGGLFEADGTRRVIYEMNGPFYKTDEERIATMHKDGIVKFTIKMYGNYEGCKLWVWYLDYVGGSELYEIRNYYYPEDQLKKEGEILKKYAYIVEWKL